VSFESRASSSGGSARGSGGFFANGSARFCCGFVLSRNLSRSTASPRSLSRDNISGASRLSSCAQAGDAT
jgi:hypothetical protein